MRRRRAGTDPPTRAPVAPATASGAAKEERIVSIPEVIGTGDADEDAATYPTFYPTLNPTRGPASAEILAEEAAEEEEPEEEVAEEEGEVAEEEDIEDVAEEYEDDEYGEDEEEYLNDDEEEEEVVVVEDEEEDEEEADEEAAAVAGIVAAPDAAYEDLAWVDLPDDVRDSMATLGYTEELWEANGVSDTDDLDWDEVDQAEQEAAAVLGFDEEAWMAEDGAAVVVAAMEADALTAHPASAAPSPHPTRALPPCPHAFNPTVEYAGGDVAEVGGHVFRCNHHDAGAYVRYCNILHWDEALLEYDSAAKELWEGAWVHLGGCGAA